VGTTLPGVAHLSSVRACTRVGRPIYGLRLAQITRYEHVVRIQLLDSDGRSGLVVEYPSRHGETTNSVLGYVLYVCHKKDTNASWRTGVFPSLDRVSGTLCLSHYMTEISHFTCTVQGTFEDTLVWRIVNVALLRRVQIFLLTYLLTYLRMCSNVEKVIRRRQTGTCMVS